MADPMTPPSFNLGYTTPVTDIGSGYAAGIAQAGKSLSGAIQSVLGGIDPQTGMVQEGVLQQGSSAHQMLDVLHSQGIIGPDEYATLKTANLGAQQKAIGMYTGMLSAKFQNALEIQKQQQALNAAMARERVSSGTSVDVANIGAAARVQAAEQRARDAEQRAAEAQAYKQGQNPRVLNQPQQPQQQQQQQALPIPNPATLKLGI